MTKHTFRTRCHRWPPMTIGFVRVSRYRSIEKRRQYIVFEITTKVVVRHVSRRTLVSFLVLLKNPFIVVAHNEETCFILLKTKWVKQVCIQKFGFENVHYVLFYNDGLFFSTTFFCSKQCSNLFILGHERYIDCTLLIVP